MVRYANDLICILINTNAKMREMRNMRKIAEKNKGVGWVTFKITLHVSTLKRVQRHVEIDEKSLWDCIYTQ